MRVLDIDELRQLMDRHPELRMHQVPMDTGLLIEDRYMLIPTAQGELTALDCEGVEEIASGPSNREGDLQYMRGGNGGGNSGSDDAALDILSSYGIAPAT